MSATGVGLIKFNREDEMMKGLDMFNIWGILYVSVHWGLTDNPIFLDKTKKAFLWYKCMYCLMGHSLIVNRSTLAHSGTPLNTDILDCNSGSIVSCSHIYPLTFVSTNSSKIVLGSNPHAGKLKGLMSCQMVPHPRYLKPPAPTPMLNVLLLLKTLILKMTLQTL